MRSYELFKIFSYSHREYEHAKFERTKAEHERTRKEEELQKLKEIALKEQNDLNGKRLNTLVDDFIRMKSLTVRNKKQFPMKISFIIYSDFTKTFL
jgi:tRNA A37 methylthiotransferase MiaB